MILRKMNLAFAGHGHGHGKERAAGGGRRPWAGGAWEGGPPWVIGVGPGAWGRSGWGAGWGGRQRRGDMKFFILEMLADGPKHGYEVILGLEEKRGIRPSAGSVYPTLQLLEDGGYVTSEQVESKRIYTITESGRKLLSSRPDGPQESGGDDEETDARRDLKRAIVKLGAAVMSARGADAETLEQIRKIVDKARKDVYVVLASDES